LPKTWPAECYTWFSKEPLGSKRIQDDGRNFGASLLRWADAQNVIGAEGVRLADEAVALDPQYM
jgi:hypothetical protein